METANRPPDPPQDFGGLRVLFVDDNAQLRRLIGMTLESLGCAVVTAEDAADAIRTLEGGYAPRLMVSDVRMPGSMDGVALAEWVSARYPDVGILLITGFTQATRIRFTLLTKPFGPDELAVGMRDALKLVAAAGPR